MRGIAQSIANRLLRDLIGLAVVIIIGGVLGFAWNVARAKSLPLRYQTPQERAANCDC